VIVEVSDEALADLRRLRAWLGENDSKAATRMAGKLSAALRSLRSFPRRAVSIGSDARELKVPFGRGGYVIRYAVREDRVVITRVFHALEDR
jgi:plasmid stabilization system protein ParE